MSSLRNLLDGKAVDIRAGDDVYKHLEQTKKAQLKYDIAKAKLHTKLAPARKMMELVDQEHPIDENNGNPDNLQNPQVDQNGKPIPNQTAPARPGIGQQQNNQQQQPVQQKKPAFSNANKTSTSSKLAKDKDNKVKSKGKGVEIHVKAGGPGSGRKPAGDNYRTTSKEKHPSAGSFARVGNGKDSTYTRYNGSGLGQGNKSYVEVYNRKGPDDKKQWSNWPKSTSIFEGHEGKYGHRTNLVHDGTQKTAQKFLKDRYGISHEFTN